MSLRRKTTHALGWQFAARTLDRGVRFGSSVVLARLLAPEDFGLVAAAMVVASATETIAFVGIDEAVAQSPRSADPRFLGTALRITALRGLVLAAIIFASAPIVAAYFESPQVAHLTRIIALSSLCLGLSNPWIHSERKELRVGPYSIAMVVGSVMQVVTALLAANFGCGAASLAYGLLANAACTVMAGWLLVPRRVDLRADASATSEFRGFARAAAGIPALIMLHQQAPALVLGRLSGLSALGVYTMADRLSSIPSEIALPVFGRVLAPVYTHVRDNQARLRHTWLVTVRSITLIAVAPAAAMFVLDDRVPQLVYGERYGTIPGLLSALAVVALLSTLASCCGPMFWGIGRPELDRKAIFVRVLVLACVSTIGAVKWGAVGFAGGIAIAYVASLAVCFPAARSVTNARWSEVLRALLPATVVALVMLLLDELTVRACVASAVRVEWSVACVALLTLVAMALSAVALKRSLRADREVVVDP